MVERERVSRRKFLGTSVGAASVVLSGSRSLKAAEAGDDLRCGVIGLGNRGKVVLSAIDRSPSVRVAALCDIHAGRLNEAAGLVEQDKPKLFDDYRKLLDHPELDAVFVETPCYLHKEMMVAVLQSGRHCYGEKPMALNIPDLDEMVRVVNATQKVFQIGTQLRYAHPWQSAVKAIHAGRIGKPVMIRGHRYIAGDLPHDCKWLFDAKLSGDTIVEQAIHELDIFNWIFKGLPERAAGFGGQAVHFEPPGRNIMDHYTLSLDYGKNKKVSYAHTFLSAPGAPVNGRGQIVSGAKGVIDVEKGKFYPRSKNKPTDLDPAVAIGHSNDMAINDFFRCVRENKKPLANVETARNCALTALLGRKAIYEKRVVTMKALLAEG